MIARRPELLGGIRRRSILDRVQQRSERRRPHRVRRLQLPHQRSLEFFGNDTYGYLRSTRGRTRASTPTRLRLAQGTVEFTDERDRVKTNSGALGTLYRFSAAHGRPL
jgi:hypothetical protein